MKENLEGSCMREEVNIPVDARVYEVSHESKGDKTQESNLSASLHGCIRCHTVCQNRPCICYK